MSTCRIIASFQKEISRNCRVRSCGDRKVALGLADAYLCNYRKSSYSLCGLQLSAHEHLTWWTTKSAQVTQRRLPVNNRSDRCRSIILGNVTCRSGKRSAPSEPMRLSSHAAAQEGRVLGGVAFEPRLPSQSPRSIPRLQAVGRRRVDNQPPIR